MRNAERFVGGFGERSVELGRSTPWRDRLGLFWLAVACLAALPLFRNGLAALWEAWQLPEYTHGPVIPLISAYLFLLQLRSVPSDPGAGRARWPGVVVMAFALVLATFGNLIQIDKFVALAIIVWVGGMILVCLGWQRGRRFWPSVLHLSFMLPLPLFLYWEISIYLQGLSAQLGVAILQAGGVPVFLDGHIIDLGIYRLHVADACSGLRYLFPIMSFSYVFAVVYRGSLWHKAALLLAAVPLAIFMNAARIGMIGFLVDAHGIDQALGFMHYFEGWVIFVLCILALLGLAWILHRLSGSGRSLVQALELDYSGMGRQLARVHAIRPSAALLASSAAFAMAAIVTTSVVQTARADIVREPFLLFPQAVGKWQGTLRPELDREVADVLAADDSISIWFDAPGRNAPVDLFMAWNADQTHAEIHSPQICLPAAGWEMARFDAVEVDAGAAGRIPVNRAIIQKGSARTLVYYWFEQNGRRYASDYLAKVSLVWNATRTGRTDGALVRISTPILNGEGESDADARLLNFLPGLVAVVPPYLGVAAADNPVR